MFAAAGQTCIAGSRCFVHARIHDEVMDRLLARTRDIVIGHPADEATEIGPIALAAQLQKVKRYVVDLVRATREPGLIDADLARAIEFGASPRA